MTSWWRHPTPPITIEVHPHPLPPTPPPLPQFRPRQHVIWRHDDVISLNFYISERDPSSRNHSWHSLAVSRVWDKWLFQRCRVLYSISLEIIMPRRRRNTRLRSRQTGHPYGTSVETAEPSEVIVIEDDGVPTPPLPPPTPLIVIDDDDDNTVPAEVPVEASAIEVPVEASAIEVPVETPAAEVPVETPAENPVECVICQEGGTLVDSNCHEYHVKVHQNCLDNWLFPRLNEPTCPHCRIVMVLSGLEVDGIHQRKRAGMTEAVSNTLEIFFYLIYTVLYPYTLASIVITCVPYVGGPGFTGMPLT